MTRARRLSAGVAAGLGVPSYSVGVSSTAETLLDLSLSRGTLDRDGNRRRDQDLLKRALGDSSSRVYDLVEGRMRTCRVDGELRLVPRAAEMADSTRTTLYLGRSEQGRDHVAVVWHDDESARPDPGVKGWRTLREAGAELGDTDAGVLTSAVALANWHARHPFCPRCGSPTTPAQGGWVRVCQEDGGEHHPRTDTAIIVAVVDDEERILLGRGPHWPQGRMSVLAGFVEAGESLEAAVTREVHEEVGLQVRELAYRGNQPWPFPASLMIGFTARTSQTQLRLDPEEIAEAAWFSRGELAWSVRSGALALPPRVSIARRLVEDWYGGEVEQPSEPTGPFRGRDAS